ncbi:MAG: transcription termination/antitermination protein NusG [Thermodesulfobacteriota bacterium]
MFNWFLIYTKPRCEDSVSSKFVENGFEVLNPKIEERRYIRRKIQDVLSPLFPCYLFVRFDIPADYRLIKYTRGVKSVVGPEHIPSVVPEEIIGQIRKRMEGGVIRMEPCSFVHGEDVSIQAGPFEGLEAVFERQLKGSERVSILLKAVNARVVVDASILKRA